MAVCLALLSGKGGSGKTTLAFSIAQMLAKSNKKVLLIDCDMSTHGATYFFEDILNDKKNILSFNDILQENYSTNKNPFNLPGYPTLYFIPSCIDFPYIFNYTRISEMHIQEIKQLLANYDIAIFDCQAGYNTVNDFVLRLSAKNLIVLEPDAVSVVSIRVLFSQYFDFLNNKNTYQVFSKVLEDEREAYKNIPHGTIFTNLEPISYDINVRRAFSSSTLPEVGENNPKMTDEIFSLLISILPKYQIEIEKYILDEKIKIRDRIINEKTKLYMLKINKYLYNISIGLVYSSLFLTIVYFIFVNLFKNIMDSKYEMLILFCILLLLAVVTLISPVSNRYFIINNDLIGNSKHSRLKKINYDINALEKKLHANNDNSITVTKNNINFN